MNAARIPSQPRTARRCAVCGRPAVAAHHPFCSERCRQVDLGRWLDGAYVIPGEKVPDEPDESDS